MNTSICCGRAVAPPHPPASPSSTLNSLSRNAPIPPILMAANRDANSGTLGGIGLIHHHGMIKLAGLVKALKVRTLVVLE